MPVEMVLHYDHKFISLGGRSVAFVKDQPRMVADDVIDECVKIGARRTDDKPAKSVPVKPKNETAPSGVGRSEAILAALKVLREENDSNKFAGTGRPKVAEVSKMAGFAADASEVSKLWDDINSEDS